MSSVLSLKSFKIDFDLPLATTGFASKTNAHISQNVVSLLTAGCFFGAIFASFANDRLGRKKSLLGFTFVFLIGAIIQVTSLHHISQVYVGRFVAGLGIGGMSSITPIYVAENCPAEVRGRITGLFQEFLVIGSTFAYWLNYGVSLHLKPSTSQWRIPVSILRDLPADTFRSSYTDIFSLDWTSTRSWRLALHWFVLLERIAKMAGQAGTLRGSNCLPRIHASR
jgi:MFS family permease